MSSREVTYFVLHPSKKHLLWGLAGEWRLDRGRNPLSSSIKQVVLVMRYLEIFKSVDFIRKAEEVRAGLGMTKAGFDSRGESKQLKIPLGLSCKTENMQQCIPLCRPSLNGGRRSQAMFGFWVQWRHIFPLEEVKQCHLLELRIHL